MTDQTQVIPAARRLLGLGAFRGAAQVLFNAAVQRQAAERLDGSEWTPFGALPLRERPEPHPHAANDHLTPSQTTA